MYGNNRNYNTRNSGRYNNSGQFVPAAEYVRRHESIVSESTGPYGFLWQLGSGSPAGPLMQCGQPGNNRFNNQKQDFANLYNPSEPQMDNYNQHNEMNQMNQINNSQTPDVEMKQEPNMNTSICSEDSTAPSRPPWMKSKLQGVKKISNKERRRRQNENLRRLVTPKNALMVLNEMMPGEQLTNQFKVEQVEQCYGPHTGTNFCADLTVDGSTYQGYGENKLTARNAAAEQAIRDIIIKRMTKALTGDAVSNGSQSGDVDEETLPMIQLASFALHKLFSEWENKGHKVPQLKPGANSMSEAGDMATPAAATATPAVRPPGAKRARAPRTPKPKVLPLNASTMHPCMLLTYMRPCLEYRELAATGDKPQTMLYTVGVDIDGATYIGKASNKKEARKAAAKAACQALFNVQFEEVAADNTPLPRA